MNVVRLPVPEDDPGVAARVHGILTRLANLREGLSAERGELPGRGAVPVLRALRTVMAEARGVAESLSDAEDPTGIFRERLLAAANGAAEELRPELDVSKAGGFEMTRVSWEAIGFANDPPELFRCGGVPVRIERDDDDVPIIRPLTPDRMRLTLDKKARWVRRTKSGTHSEVPPPLQAATAALAWPDPPLPILARIVEVPVLGPDGALAEAPGYHAPTRTFYAPPPGFLLPSVPETPGEADIVAARDLIVGELLGEFPFVGEAELAHAVGLLFLPFVRDLIAGPTPLHLIEKPTPGTGATLLADVLAMPALGRPLPAMSQGDGEEMRKRITATLLRSPSHVLIDNLRGRLDSSALAAVLTALTWNDRVLGASEMCSLPVRCAWIATGNNPLLSDEIARRTVRIRLDAGEERPQLRAGFRHPDLRAFARERRGQLIGAALTLCRAWICAGKPEPGVPPLGAYEEWTATIGGILHVADIPGFLGNLGDFYEVAEDEGHLWREFVRRWASVHGADRVTAGDLLDLADETLRLPNGSDKGRVTALGKQLSSRRDQRYGEWRISRGPMRSGSVTYELVRVSQ